MVLEYGSLTLAVVLLYLVYYHPLEFHYHVAKGLLSSPYTINLPLKITVDEMRAKLARLTDVTLMFLQSFDNVKLTSLQ